MTLARNLADLGNQVDSSGTLGIGGGGTSATTANASFNALAPSQTGNSGKYLTTNGTDTSWGTISTSTVNQAVINTNTNASSGYYYTITANLTLTLPSSPTSGMYIGFSNLSGLTTPVIARNGSNIMASATDLTLDSTYARGLLVYADATNGWVLFNN